MVRSLDPRWHSKESLLDSIREIVVASGLEMRRLGSAGSDTFEVYGKTISPLVVALKESGKKRAEEKNPLWIGVPNAFLGRFLELIESKTKADFMFILIDHWDQHLIVIPAGPALRTMISRERKGRELHLSFDVKKTGSGYALVTPRDEADIGLRHIDTLEPLKELLAKHP